MALTDREKQRIAEEEEYRAKIREESHSQNHISSQTNKKGFNGCLVLLVLIVALFAITFISINPAKQFEDAEKAVQEHQVIETKSGNFQDFTGKEYAYDINYETGKDKYVASFQPFLKNDDRILVQAILELFMAIYGENSLIDPTPLLEARNGINLIKFRGDTAYYYVSPIKEDTGEIHTLLFWRE
jgi:hypothetical protein